MNGKPQAMPRKWRRWLIVAGVVALLLALVAFAGYRFATAPDALHLTVTQFPDSPGAPDAPRVVLDTTVSDAATKQLYTHLLALPDVRIPPGSVTSCPIGPPYSYRLTFSSHLDATLVDAKIATDTCPFLGPVFGQQKVVDDQFWALLRQAVGQPLPYGQTS